MKYNEIVYMAYTDKLINGSPKELDVERPDHAVGRRQGRPEGAATSSNERSGSDRHRASVLPISSGRCMPVTPWHAKPASDHLSSTVPELKGVGVQAHQMTNSTPTTSQRDPAPSVGKTLAEMVIPPTRAHTRKAWQNCHTSMHRRKGTMVIAPFFRQQTARPPCLESGPMLKNLLMTTPSLFYVGFGCLRCRSSRRALPRRSTSLPSPSLCSPGQADTSAATPVTPFDNKTSFNGVRGGNFEQSKANGFTGGGQIGYNMQIGNGLFGSLPVIGGFGNGGAGGGLVIGVEADASYTDYRS